MSTLQQLGADFPNGNWIYDNCVFKSRKFKVYYISGFYLLLHEIKTVLVGWQFLFKALLEKRENYIVDSVRQDFRYVVSQLNNAGSTFNKLDLSNKAIFALVVVGLALPIFLFTLIYVLLKIIYSYTRLVCEMGMNKSRVGSFNLSLNDSAIVLYSRNLSEYPEEYKRSIITHEHMHLIQYFYKSKFSIKVKHLSNTAMNYVFSVDKLKRDYFCYIISEQELEVRIHEMLVSYYRAYDKLPESLSELETCYLEYIIGENYDKNGNVYVSKMVYRNHTNADDLRLIYMSVKPKFDEIFMSELIGVLYANLLDYYGLDYRSKVIRSEIAGPNLSSYLYQKIF
ncbi:hypothetical protein [Cobetia amphilecti]|uniref:Uncharacterized protein n=1 Tax=Cobetia amphilecti TaxID=1055104 RepID=A0AAP4TX82_9GAMM|nr:hypothetical protein [Cobetia amphilecti]MDO6671350.1 hypothetical protein [Cobetia amphilecti]